MAFNIYDFLSEEEYKEACEGLRSNESRVVYSNEMIDVEIRKAGKRILTFVNTYGDRKLNEVLNKVSSLV